MIEDMMRALGRGKVLISFQSLTSDQLHKKVFTLVGAYSACSITHGDKIVLLNPLTGGYEDIEKRTIVSWTPVESNQ